MRERRMVAANQGTYHHMPTSTLLRIGTVSVLVALMGLVGGCNRFGSGEVTTSLTSDETSCVVAKEQVSAGPVTFEITNKGKQPASYEVRREGDDGRFTDLVMSARDVAAGDEATMSGKLGAGQFQVRCLLASGRTPTAIVRTSVNGAAKPREDIGPSRTFRFTVSRDGVVDPPAPLRAKTGDLVTFALDNRSDRSARLMVLRPDGRQTSSVTADSRTSRETNVVLSSVGTYTVRVGRNGDRFSLQVSR